MLKLGILGIGNCGNQLADLGKSSKNIPGLAINTSEKDINNVKGIDTIMIGDNKGAGKDRSIAKSFVRKVIKELLAQEKFDNFISEQEVIVVASSTGGGSGSGISPMLCHLLSEVYKDKKFILLHVLPSLKESLVAQQNTVEYLKEILKSEPTYMSYDNGRHDNVPANVMMKDVNTQIIEDLCVLRGDYQIPTVYTSIDEKDAFKILSTKGRIQVARVQAIKEKDLDNKSIETMIIDAIKHTTHMTEFQRDASVKRTGVILNLNAKINDMLDSNLTEVKKFVGEPVEGFEHIAILDNSLVEMKNNVLLMMAGLSMPEDRIEKISQRVTEIENQLKTENAPSLLNQIDTNEIGDIRRGIDVEKKPEVKEINIEELMSSYF